MEPKPKGWGTKYGAVFRERSVVDAYPLRPPYPEATIDLLAELAGGGAVLDAGCGTGELARRLAPRVERVDAVDVSERMVALARTLPGGDAPNVRWVVASIETAELDPPYALAVAGDSVHWFEWETALPRLASALAPGAPFAIVHRNWFRDPALAERLRPVWDEHSWNVDFEPLEPVPELERRGLFERLGERTVEPDPWRPTVDELVDSQRSVSAFVREKLRDPAAFDAALREAVADRVAPDGRLDLDVDATVVWGLPRA